MYNDMRVLWNSFWIFSSTAGRKRRSHKQRQCPDCLKATDHETEAFLVQWSLHRPRERDLATSPSSRSDLIQKWQKEKLISTIYDLSRTFNSSAAAIVILFFALHWEKNVFLVSIAISKFQSRHKRVTLSIVEVNIVKSVAQLSPSGHVRCQSKSVCSRAQEHTNSIRRLVKPTAAGQQFSWVNLNDLSRDFMNNFLSSEAAGRSEWVWNTRNGEKFVLCLPVVRIPIQTNCAVRLALPRS